MQKTEAAMILAGVKPEEQRQASAPTNLHVITGTVTGKSDSGKTRVSIDGLVFTSDNSQYIEIDTLGGLEEGDTATILLTGENGRGMTPLAVGAPGSIDRIDVRIKSIEADYIKATVLDAEVARLGYLTANSAKIQELEVGKEFVDDLTANNIDVNRLVANSAFIEDLELDNITADKITAASGYIEDLTAKSITTDDIQAASGYIEDLTAKSITTTNIQAASGYIGSLTAQNISAADIAADHGTIGRLDSTYATIANLNAANGRIDNLQSSKANVTDLTAATGRITSLEATDVNITGRLDAAEAVIDDLDANYIHTDMLNADVAWLQNGVIKDGSIVNGMIHDVSANKLTAGTIDASNITVTNLNADNITTGTINGQRIGTGSLSLDKLEEDVYTETEVNNIVAGLQTQIDGAIETWTGTSVPTLQNAPAVNWNTNAKKDSHVGDVYFVVNSNSQQNGYNYRFTKSGNTYSWQLIKDSDVTNALARLSTAEGKITTFDSDISTLKTDTGTLKTKTTSLETRMSDAEDDILDKVDTTTFTEVSDTVDSHSQSITQMSQTLSNKADNSTVTAVTQRVSKTEQDISGINTTIGSLQTTVESKADGSTVETISSNLNTISNTVDGHTQSISSINSTLETKADSSTVSTLSSKVNTVSDTVDGHTSQLSSITSTQTTIQGSAVKSTVQLWFTKSNTTAPNKPTAHVTTNNASTANAWNLAVPTYNASYPNYFYCYEYEYLNGTYGWSAVTRDIATGEAQSTARTAASDASTAKTNASNAVSTASTANTNASNAVSTANTAASDASTAKTNAASAVSTANTANTNASNAVSTANTANTNASNAVSTANTAKSTADKNLRTSQQLWFTKANSTAPNKPTSKVTSEATTGNAWTTKVPTYNDGYKYYFYCMQYIAADGTVTWSDVVYDQATTEAQSVARTASTNINTLQSDYATFKQTTQQFESTIGTTIDQKVQTGIANLEIGGRNLFVKTDVYANNPTSGTYTFGGAASLVNLIPEGRTITISVDIDADDVVWESSGSRRIGVEFSISKTGGGYQYIGAWAGFETSEGANVVEAFTGSFHKRISKSFTLLGDIPLGRDAFLYVQNVSSGTVRLGHVKVEYGNTATDWSPSPEDIESQVSSIEQRVSTNETSISNNATQISLRAKSSDVYTKTQTDGLISTEVTNRNAAITESARAINLNVSENYTTKTEFNNLEIGGRNLLPYSKPSEENLPKVSTASSTNAFAIEDGFACYKGTGGGTNSAFYASSGKLIVILEADTQYTYSAWVKLTTTTSATSVPFNFSSLGHFTVRNLDSTASDKTHEDVAAKRIYSPSMVPIGQWTKITLTFTTNSLSGSQFGVYSKYNYGTEYTFYIRDMKLEKGNKATDWSPAPEDISTHFESVESSITQTAQNIRSEVSKVSSAKYVNASTASWPLSSIKTYAAEGHGEGWNVTSTDGLRAGDTVYIKGTDSTRGCTVYIKTTVTSIENATHFTGVSHGYEDVLPVETIKSTINQSSDSVKIQARHVEIDGEAIFSAISDDISAQTEIDRTNSGKSVWVTDGALASLKGLHILGESVQDGTPTPSAPVPIVSVAPANLIRYEAWKNRTYTVDRGTGVFENNGITITATENDCYTNISAFPAEARIPVNEGETVFLIWESPDAVSGIVYIFGNGGTTSMAYQNNLHMRYVNYNVPSGVSYITFRFGVAAAGTTIRYQNIRITKGRTLPFTPSNSVGILTRGKNLLRLPSYQTTTRNGLTFSLDSNTETISVSGTATANNTDLGINLPESINVPDGASVTLSFHGTVSSGGMMAFLYDGTYFEHHSLSGNSMTFTQAGGRVIKSILLRWNPAYGAQNINAQMQLELGSEATEYEPYRGAITPIPLNGHELRSLPDGTQDELTVDVDGHVTMIQRVGSATLDGSIAPTGATAAMAYFNVSSLDILPPVLTTRGSMGYCNRYEVTSNFIGSAPVDMRVVINATAFSGTPRIAFYDSTHASAFGTWLQSNSVTLLYQLATPQTIDLGNIDMPQINDGDTVEVIAAVTPSIDATWFTKAGQSVADIQSNVTVIDGARIRTGSVTAEKLTAGTITSDQIAAGAISADRLDANALTLGNIDGLEDRLAAIDSGLSTLSNSTQWVNFQENVGTVFGEEGSANNVTVKADGVYFNTEGGEAARASAGIFYSNEVQANDSISAPIIKIGNWALIQSGTTFSIEYLG